MKQTEKTLLASIIFEADKMLPKMKKCIEKRRNIKYPYKNYPAIDMQRGIMVATDGHILVAHKLKSYCFEPADNVMLSEVVMLPADVLKMKGRVEVTLENRNDMTYAVVTDETGATCEMSNDARYPNWRSAVHSTTGYPIGVNWKLWDNNLKEIIPKMDSEVYPVRLFGEQKSETLTMGWENYDVSDQGSMSVDVEEMPYKMFVVLNAKRLRDVLVFQPKEMRFVDSTRAVIFVTDETLCLLMPLLMDNGRRCSVDRRYYETFDLDKWIGADLGEVVVDNRAMPKGSENGVRTECKGSEKGKKNSQPSAISHQTSKATTPTLADRLRAALLQQMKKAA